MKGKILSRVAGEDFLWYDIRLNLLTNYMNFKMWLEAEEQEPKGAFKDFPEDQQPVRIPIEKFPLLAEKVRELLAPHGEIFIPDASKKALKKKTTGDLDVLFIPHDRKNWMKIVRSVIPGIVAETRNGPQLMLVVKGLIDDKQYMVDIILSQRESWDFRRFYFSYGGIMPAVLGSFARCLGYKLGQDGLFIRLKDLKNNFHNYKLTNDTTTAFRILGLDPKALESDQLYTPEGMAQWITDSPRFDSDRWRNPPEDDGMTIVVKNQKAHRAAKKRPEVKRAYEIIDGTNKKATITNENFRMERAALGDNFVDEMLRKINEIKEKSRPAILSGHEIMQVLNIPPGPEIGKWVRFLATHPALKDADPNDPTAKELAKQLLLRQ